MAASRTGTQSAVAGQPASGSTSVTVPADCNLVVAFWLHYHTGAGTTLSTCTLNSVSFTTRSESGDSFGGSSEHPGVGVATLSNPSTGTQTFAWAWSSGTACAFGGRIYLVYCKDAYTTDPVDDADNVSETSTNNVEITLTTVSTDLVLAFCGVYSSTPVLSGTVFVDNGVYSSVTHDMSEVTAGASSTTITMTGESYTGMAAIALKAIPSAGSILLPMINYS